MVVVKEIISSLDGKITVGCHSDLSVVRLSFLSNESPFGEGCIYLNLDCHEDKGFKYF